MSTSSETSTSSAYTVSEEQEMCARCCIVAQQDFENSDFFIIHTKRENIKERLKDSKKQKKALLDNIMKIVTALRNSNGGKLVIHIEGQQFGDKYLEYFDEFISNPLRSLLQDGQLYFKALYRCWLPELSCQYRDFYDFVIVHVTKGDGLTTVDFNTKVVTDNELVNPSFLNMAKLMEKSEGNTKPSIRGLEKLESLHESRHVQLKAFQPNLPKHEDLMLNTESFVEYIWSHLKLKHYITAFSKVPSGGSFFVGVSENRLNLKDGYRTTTPVVVGFCVNYPEKIMAHLDSKIKKNLLVLDNGGLFHDFPSDHISCRFHEVIDTSPQRFVLEVSVGCVKGIVFSEKDGPRSYRMKGSEVVRMDAEEWLKRFKSSYCRCQTCK